MKKIILSGIIIFMILTISHASFAVTATVNVTAVRIREFASTQANIVTNIYQEDEVEVLEENGEWYKVKYAEKIGYAKAEFFTKKKEETQNTVANEKSTQEPQNNAENGESTERNLVPNEENGQTVPVQLKVGETVALSNNIKVRVMPNLSTIARTEIVQGTNVTIETKLGNWYKITNQTISGWITESKLTTQLAANEPPVATQPPAQPETQVPQTPPNTTEPKETTPEPTQEKPQETKQPKEEKPTTNKTAIVIVETARVRKTASTNSDIVDVLDEDDIVTITGEEGNFYKITSDKIGSGYISKSLVKQKDVSARSTVEERDNTINKEAKEENKPESQEKNSAVTGNDIVGFAKQFLKYPYVLGASSPEKGFDCSGFTRYVYGHFGFSLGQVAASQTSLGAVVERENLQIGDLILFYNDGKTKIGHCGIFIGGGDFIHSANPQRGVVIDNLNSNSYYSQRFVTARRIVE